MDKTHIQKAVTIIGGQSETARLLGIKQQTVQGWVKNNYIPPKWVLKIERLADMRVSCFDLAPKIYPRKRFQQFFDKDASLEIDRLTVENEALRHQLVYLLDELYDQNGEEK